MKSPDRFSAILGASPKLRELTERARLLAALGVRIADLFEHPLDRHVKLASLHDDVLVLQADSPAWAARARYLVPRLLERLATLQDFPPVRTIRIRVGIPAHEVPAPPGRQQSMSKQAADGLRRQASGIADPALRAVLMRIAGGRRPK